VHQPGVFSGTCESSLTLTAWYEAPGFLTPTLGDPDWFFSGTAVTHPAGQTAFCQTLPGVPPPTFSNFDSVLPAAAGHTSQNGLVLPGGFTFRASRRREYLAISLNTWPSAWTLDQRFALSEAEAPDDGASTDACPPVTRR